MWKLPLFFWLFILPGIAVSDDVPPPTIEATEAVARKNWNLAFPGRTLHLQRSDNVLIAMESHSRRALPLERQSKSVLKECFQQLGLPKDCTLTPPLLVYVIPKRYDLSEWNQMVEKRTSVQFSNLQWHTSEGQGYIILGPDTLTDKREVADEARFARVLTSAVLGQWGAPAWYADGRGLLVRSQMARRDVRVRRWQAGAPRVLSQIEDAKDLIESRLSKDQTGLAAWAFTSYLNRDRRRVARLHTALREGKDFDDSFQIVYGASPTDVASRWLRTFRQSGR